MRTPQSRDCKFFYGDYYRGRDFEECRALVDPRDKKDWTSAACKNCPMPVILRDNRCQNMTLTAYFRKGIFGNRIQVKAWCSRSNGIVQKPEIGCGLCHMPPEPTER